MSQGQKPAANRMMMMQFKLRVVGAKKGFGLLKKKRDALKARFQQMLREIIDCKKECGMILNEGAFSLAKAKWACDSEITTPILARCKKPSITTKLKADNVAGVQLPVFTMVRDTSKEAELESLGIAQGGQVLQAAREQNVRAIELLIQMASLQTAFQTLDEAIKMTSRRVNALEYVVIPRLEGIVQWIKGEMDEIEREEFFRVKKVVEKKKIKMQKEKDLWAKQEAAKQAGSAIAGKDADIMF